MLRMLDVAATVREVQLVGLEPDLSQREFLEKKGPHCRRVGATKSITLRERVGTHYQHEALP